MSSVGEWVAREYFEQLGYLVHQPRKYIGIVGQRSTAQEADLVICNPNVAEHRVPGHMVWNTEDLSHVARAVVAVCGWHSERTYPGMFEQQRDLLRFVEPASLKHAARVLGSQDMARVLCITRLPASGESREKTIAILKERGIQGVIAFDTMLADLVAGVEKNRNYEKSDLLQIIRLLKIYGFIKDPQMELFGHKAPPARGRARRAAAPEAETAS